MGGVRTQNASSNDMMSRTTLLFLFVGRLSSDMADHGPPAPAESDPAPEQPATKAPECAPATLAPLSRKAQKRQLKEQHFEARREERRAQRKEKKQLLKEKRRSRTTEEEAAQRRAARGSQTLSNVRVVVDAGFETLMSDKETVSCLRQLARCYAESRRAAHPVQLSVCGVGPGMEAHLDKLQRDWRAWKMPIVSTPLKEHVTDHSNVVYLTADSPHILHDLDDTKAYVIGGIVDKNRHKNLCLDRATDMGVQTAQLPIGEFIKLNTRKVLTVNQVLEIMLRYLETKDWKEAFLHVIPQRKINEKPRKKGQKWDNQATGDGDANVDNEADVGGDGNAQDGAGGKTQTEVFTAK
ncbi:guanine-1-methyltransferase-domain-containing protein [Chytriomyces sp. MP71]|nr:guanine-1-methyltransferase-domain-containing protein [Chytriomyces sp. MP71]